MRRQGRDLEALVALLEQQLGPTGVIVESPARLPAAHRGRAREVDVALKGKVGSADVLVIIECRDRSRAADVRWVEEVAAKRNDVGADKALLVSARGFSKSAEERAAQLGIELRSAKNVDISEIGDWFASPVIQYVKYRARFVHVEVNLADTGQPFEITAAGREAFQHITHNDKLFTRRDTGARVSLWDIWTWCDPRETYEDVPWDGTRVRKTAKINVAGGSPRVFLSETPDERELESILAHVELWVDVSTRPLAGVRQYRDGDQLLAETARWELQHDIGTLALETHFFPDTGEQALTLRLVDAVASDPASAAKSEKDGNAHA